MNFWIAVLWIYAALQSIEDEEDEDKLLVFISNYETSSDDTVSWSYPVFNRKLRYILLVMIDFEGEEMI